MKIVIIIFVIRFQFRQNLNVVLIRQININF